MSDSAPMAFIEWVDAAPATDNLAPKKVEALVEQKEKPAAEPEGDATKTKKRGSVGSKTAAAKAKRAETKTRKIAGRAIQEAKPKPILRKGRKKS